MSFGNTSGGGKNATSTSVPETASFVLLLTGIVITGALHLPIPNKRQDIFAPFSQTCSRLSVGIYQYCTRFQTGLSRALGLTVYFSESCASNRDLKPAPCLVRFPEENSLSCTISCETLQRCSETPSQSGQKSVAEIRFEMC
jgi:hypothetical protein